MLGHTLEDVLRHVPAIDLRNDGDCAQANGLDLPVVAINLTHRTDRWRALTSRMSAAGLTKLIRAPAIEGSRLTNGQIAGFLDASADAIDRSPRSHLHLTRPAIGCFLSHLAVWRWVMAANTPRVLVLEDDAAPARDYCPARFREAVAALPEHAGLVFPGRIIMGGLADRPQGAALARLYYFNGTFAYLITPAACRALLRHLLPPRWHIDHQISKVLMEQRHAIAAYYTEPAFFEPDWSLQSDCYVPLADESEADRELEGLIEARRRALLAEGRPLLAA